jgi:Lon protease-like protein
LDQHAVNKIPLFPLRSVLCPGVALPLHIFEDRYRLMISRCIDRDEPFGVVLLRDGSEVGPSHAQVASVGTTAAIRRAGAYPDGRLDIVTVGQQRFRLEGIDSTTEPYLIGHIRLLDEATGLDAEARTRAAAVGRRFIEYLELLQPVGAEDGPEIEIEIELEVDDPDDQMAVDDPLAVGDAPRPMEDPGSADGPLLRDLPDPLLQEIDASDLTPEQRRELLMAAARRLTGTDDPTTLSYVLTALIQVDLSVRQELLETPDTVTRLERLDGLLSRESWFLRQGLRPIIVDPAVTGVARG